MIGFLTSRRPSMRAGYVLVGCALAVTLLGGWAVDRR